MANDRQPQNSSESLARSHSKVSNAKLTALCIATVIVFSCFWFFLALVDNGSGGISKEIAVIIAAAFGGLTVLCLIGFSKFTR